MASKKYFVDINLQSNKVDNLKADTLDITDTVNNPASANTKRIVYWSGVYYYSDGTNWVAMNGSGGGVSNVTATSPLSSSGGATPDISISQASASTNGYLSSTDWSTFNSKQDALGFTPENVANKSNSYTVSSTTTYANTKALVDGLATKQDTINLTTTGTSGAATLIGNTLNIPQYSGGSGTVTSVGLSMPSAFNVSNSPITTNGSISVTGAGTTSQYIRGDGSLATYNPGGGGGGASQVFYFNGSVASSVVGYEQMSTAANTGASSDFTISSNGYIASFLTDIGSPNQLNIPAGNWNFEIYFSASSSGGNPNFYVELYKYDGSTFSLISSSSLNPETITNGTDVDLYTTSLTVPATTLLVTDRLAVRVYVNNSGRTITMHTQDSNLSEVITTFSTGITALNGLTAQIQNFAVGTSGTDFNISSVTDTHTFNLPTASATNRGALSSTDWSTFNGKQATISLTTTGSSGSSTFISNTLNVPTYTLSGLGGVPTSRTITINGTAQDLSADRTYTVTDANLSISDITTNNVSTSQHGFAPKLPNDATKYLDGTGNYSTPAGGGGSVDILQYQVFS